ncbi:molybdate transport repressor [Campylobacter sp. faydin G-24]|uniref:Molybdate transport repressor n=1 Tax=Campylobacter anatolicus TaxID=2829105 RepID=A0ABS5HGI7_9BACT|nr:molybdate transport repressor [Campylobacter anatolicus]MBR8463335.1 molybdate transport repressor [Campylobacter anatolicus]
MQIFEDKKGAKSGAIFATLLFVAGFIGSFYYELGNSAIFAMIVGALCVAFCVKKIFQVSFLQVVDDGFIVQKGSKSAKFKFNDIEKISIKLIDKKKNAEVLLVEFKKNRLDRDLVDGLIQPLGERDAVILDKYELNKYELSTILMDALQKQANKKN